MSFIFKKLVLSLIVLLYISESSAAEWYEGGTLSGAGILEWQNSTSKNKVATSADMAASLYLDKKLKSSISSNINGMDDLKPLAINLASCIEAASKKDLNPDVNNKMYANQTVSGFAAICIITMEWTK